MKTITTNENFTSTIGENSTSFGIDDENQAFIIEALSKNIYRDPIGTIVREYSSNAWDANVDAGVNEPIIVSLDSDATGEFFSVVDFGDGMSEEKIKTVFVKYGKSTKGGNNDEIGGFGIGAKSAFSYADTFFVNTVSEGVLYKYMVSKTNQNPEMTLLNSTPVNSPSGTEIRIYLKPNYAEFSTFLDKIKRQLLHFKNVVVKVSGEIDEDFASRKIFTEESFELTSKSSYYFNHAYALIGPVAYPIEYSIIGEESYRVPVGIKFGIGELDVTLSREELRYTEETIAAIKKRLCELKDTLVKRNSKRSWWCKTPEDFYAKGDSHLNLEFGELSLPAPLSIRNANKNHRFKVMGVHPELNYPTNILPYLKIFAIYDGQNITRVGNGSSAKSVTYSSTFENPNSITYLHDEKTISTIKLKWLREQNGYKNIVLLKKVSLSFKRYRDLTGTTIPEYNKYEPIISEKGNFTKRIMSFKKKVERPIINKLPKFSEIEVPKEFIEENRASNPSVAISGLEFNDLERPFGKSYRKIRIDGQRMKLDRNHHVDTDKIVLIYTDSKDEEDLAKLKSIEHSGMIKVYEKSRTDYSGDNVVAVFKRVFIVQATKKKSLEFLKGASFAMSLEEATKLIRPTELMKKKRLRMFWTYNLESDLASFLRKRGIIKSQMESKAPSSLEWNEKDTEIRESNCYRTVHGELYELDNVPQDWVYDLKKIKRYEKTFREFGVLNHNLFSASANTLGLNETRIEQEILSEIYRKRAVLPSLKSQTPIYDWERELIKEGEDKKEYLQSLV